MILGFVIGLCLGAGALYGVQWYRARQAKVEADRVAAWQAKK